MKASVQMIKKKVMETVKSQKQVEIKIKAADDVYATGIQEWTILSNALDGIALK